MGRRVRHFSWKAIGASAVLDARRITGVNNNAAFQTWPDVSGNGRDFSNPTAGRRPTYEAAGLNGLPCVFNASLAIGSSTGMLRTTTLPVGTSGEESQFCVLRFTGNQGSYQAVMGNGGTGANCFWIATNSANNVAAYGFNSSTSAEASSVDGALSTASEIVSIDGDTSGKRMRRSGVSQTLTNPTVLVRPDRGTQSTPNTLGGPFDSQTLGASIFSDKYNSTMVGRIGIAAWVPYVVAASLRKRVEHSMAFSYKIPCS